MGNTLEGTSATVGVVIVGGGPTGLGAAYRLHQRGVEDWLLLDTEKHPGGLAGSVKTSEGFRFDHGIKTITSRSEYFKQLLDKLFDEKNGHELQRLTCDNFVYIGGQLVKYPIQNNLGSLPPSEREGCLVDLLKAKLAQLDVTEDKTAANLDDHLVSEWGEKMCNIFFRPYIYKQLAFPTGKLSYAWTPSKVPPFRVAEDFSKVLSGGDAKDSGWGQDLESVYPIKGGLANFWRTLSKVLPKNNVRFRCEISKLDVEGRNLTTRAGLEIKYEHMVSSISLPSLLNMCEREDLGRTLVHTSLFVVCVGVRGKTHHPNITGCIYFPESDTLFHRVSVFSNRDPDSVPNDDVILPTVRLANPEATELEEKPGPYWSLLCEVSGGPLKAIDDKTIVEDVIRDACAVGLLHDDDEIVTLHLTEMTHGHPLPTLQSEEKIKESLGWLKSKKIWSRGRFGAFKYGLGDIESSFIQGVEAVDNIFDEKSEKCLFESHDVTNTVTVTSPDYEIAAVDTSVTSSTVSVSSYVATESSLSADQVSDSSGEIQTKSDDL